MIIKSLMLKMRMKVINCSALLLLILLQNAWSQNSLPGNLGDRLDKNDIPGNEELREEEFINRPDYIDRNKIPSYSEGRAREEEIEPVDLKMQQKDKRRTE
jgi:hypothetical protein